MRFEDLDVWNDLDGLAAMLSQLDGMVSAAVATSAIADCVGTPNIVLVILPP